jgi:hypothetical protein
VGDIKALRALLAALGCIAAVRRDAIQARLVTGRS